MKGEGGNGEGVRQVFQVVGGGGCTPGYMVNSKEIN